MFKKIGVVLVALAAALTSCRNDQFAEQQTKDFWTQQIEGYKGADAATFKKDFNDCLARGEIVVKETKDIDLAPIALHVKFLEAAIVTPQKDTLADLIYMKEFAIYNDRHKEKTGEESALNETTRMTIRTKPIGQTVMREEKTIFFTNKSLQTKTSYHN